MTKLKRKQTTGGQDEDKDPGELYRINDARQE